MPSITKSWLVSAQKAWSSELRQDPQLGLKFLRSLPPVLEVNAENLVGLPYWNQEN
jgi:hypothetical protein